MPDLNNLKDQDSRDSDPTLSLFRVPFVCLFGHIGLVAASQPQWSLCCDGWVAASHSNKWAEGWWHVITGGSGAGACPASQHSPVADMCATLDSIELKEGAFSSQLHHLMPHIAIHTAAVSKQTTGGTFLPSILQHRHTSPTCLIMFSQP